MVTKKNKIALDVADESVEQNPEETLPEGEIVEEDEPVIITEEPAKKPPVDAQTLNPRAILAAAKALLAFSHPNITNHEQVQVNGSSEARSVTSGLLRVAHDKAPLQDRMDRLKALTSGVSLEEICSNSAIHAGLFQQVVDIIAEAWGGGVPPTMKR